MYLKKKHVIFIFLLMKEYFKNSMLVSIRIKQHNCFHNW